MVIPDTFQPGLHAGGRGVETIMVDATTDSLPKGSRQGKDIVRVTFRAGTEHETNNYSCLESRCKTVRKNGLVSGDFLP